MSRIEVTKSPTPDTPADTIGGSVNMVLKSAFERAKPIFNYRVNLNANFNDAQDINFVSLKKTPGPAYERTVKIKPGFDLNYIRPVSKNFGYTVSLMSANQFTPESFSASQWKPVTTTSTLAPPDNPFLSTFRTRDGPKEIYRWSVGATFDWRVRPNDVVSVAGQWNRFDTTVVNYEVTFDANGTRTALPDRYGPTFMESASGAGSIAHAVTYQHKIGSGYNLRLTHRHTGPVWKTESGAAYSSSVSEFTGLEDDTVRVVNARLTNATLHFENIVQSQPRAVSAFTTTGAPLDHRSLADYTLVSVTSAPSKQANVTTSAFTNATRQFNGRIPLRVKAGLDARLEGRDFRSPTDTWNFVGPDGVANTADDRMGLYDLVFTEYAGVPQPFGLGKIERPNNRKTYELLKARPNYFQKNDVTSLSSAVAQSRYLEEAITAGYVRLDTGFLNNRLKLTGGVRYEETFDEGNGQLNDIGATYQRDANGRIVRNAAGQPLRLPGDTLTLAKLQYTDRGSHGKRHYGDFYPSFNGSFQITEKLLFRTSYAETITRPQLSTIVPSSTASDPTATTGIPTITVNNTALKPWSSRSYDVALEYYFEQPGLISIGAFQKDIKNFFGSTRTPATLEQLDDFGFDESYLGYDIVTLSNVGDAKISGIEFDYRQSLTFLPKWASGVSIFANGTSLHLQGASLSDFSGFISKTTNWGVSLSRPRYTVKLNWNLRGRQRLAAVTGANVPAGSYSYRSPRQTLDLNAEWRVTRSISLFANLRNITNVRWREETYGPDTPAYARYTNVFEYGAQGIFGVKGSF
jgi:iron complex outermembrane recepter protein